MAPPRLAYVLTAWAPVLLCAAGLLVTFAAGLWNIGIEGQVVLGAIFATGVLRWLQPSLPPALTLIAAALGAALGGALWGVLTGLLKRYGNVNEIFGGLGLNFIAGSLTVYLVLGPGSALASAPRAAPSHSRHRCGCRPFPVSRSARWKFSWPWRQLRWSALRCAAPTSACGSRPSARTCAPPTPWASPPIATCCWPLPSAARSLAWPAGC
ncbi:hypothetical protein [Candidatus Amarolinea dominans]|uniref:ABC transporter permease subunit n=1 Tax=Candidatus Amarolinea dominans TaxID=3140696 RepID=UPI0031CC5165